jgi:hypothetical protein
MLLARYCAAGSVPRPPSEQESFVREMELWAMEVCCCWRMRLLAFPQKSIDSSPPRLVAGNFEFYCRMDSSGSSGSPT